MTNFSCDFASVSRSTSEEVTTLFNRETIDRNNNVTENSSIIPERYKNPTDVTQQKRYLVEKKCGTRKCYTCFPKRLAKEHTISCDEKNSVKFHFDMCNRPIIIATPIKHIKNLEDFDTPEELSSFFNAIKCFCIFWNIKDYQILINHGQWKHHEHLHAKIKGNEDIIYKLRQDHFKLIRLTKDRTADTNKI